MCTIYIEIDGKMKTCQTSLLNVDKIIMESIVKFIGDDIDLFKMFTKNIRPKNKLITLNDYNNFLNLNERENVAIEIYYTEDNQSPIYADIDFWINYISKNRNKRHKKG